MSGPNNQFDVIYHLSYIRNIFSKEDIVSHDEDASVLVLLEIFLSTPLRQDS